MALMSSKSWPDWIAEYAQSHQNPTNRWCHTIGIPLITLSLVAFAASPVVPHLWIAAAALFVIGWVFQLVGHAYEHKPPEFTKDWRFLFVGLRWWLEKMRGRG